MLAEERYKMILEQLNREGTVRVADLVRQFNVSTETIRRDLEYLESKKLLNRVYGGAVSNQHGSVDGSERTTYVALKSRIDEQIEEKRKIARTALSLISENDSIALDSGTTTLELARLLKDHFKKLTVLTNSLMVLNELSGVDSYTVISTGGILKTDELSLIGDTALATIENFNIDKAFLSVSGISSKSGLTDWRMDEIRIQQKMIAVSQKVVVLADQTKFKTTSLLRICDISRIHAIVTDQPLDETILRDYESQKVAIYS